MPQFKASLALAFLVGSIWLPKEYKPLGIQVGATLGLIAHLENEKYTRSKPSRIHQIKNNHEILWDYFDAKSPKVSLSAQGKSLEIKSENLVTSYEIPTNEFTPDGDFSEILNARNTHPHIMVVGKTGGGKSTLTQWLASQSGKGKIFVIDPHYNRGSKQENWISANGIFGIGRAYGTDKDKACDYQELISNQVENPSIASILKAIYLEMDRRYSAGIDFNAYETHDWIIDETPAIASSLSEVFPETLKPLIREARKVGIRIWLITQSDRVESLKIKGEGDLRMNFTYIYLKDAAYNRANKLKLSDEKLAWLKSQPYPCIVDSDIKQLPDYRIMQSDIQSSIPENRFVCYPVVQDFDVKSAQSKLPSSKPKTIGDALTDAQAYFHLYSYGLDSGMNKTDIIKNLWQLTGHSFKIGNELWNYFESRELDDIPVDKHF